MSDVITIGIAGGTGSGKTTITRRILDEFGGDVSVLYHDNYYKRHDDIPFAERKKLNYDHPNAFDTPLLVQHLDALRAGQVGAQHAAFAAGVALRAEEGEWIALQAALQLVQLQLPAFAFGHRFAHRFLPFRRCSVSSARPARGTSSQSGR